jgi:ABC-type transporter Mla subunit MlaD
MHPIKVLQQILVCAFLAALTALVVCAILLLRAATATVSAIPGELEGTRAELIGVVEAAREDLAAQVGFARQDVLARSERQLAALRTDALTEVAEIRKMVDRRLGDTLARADTALGTVEALRQGLQPALDNSAAIAAQVNASLPLFLDCDHNVDCVFNRYVGVSKGMERAAQNFGQASTTFDHAFPRILGSADSLVADSAATAANIKRLTTPRWYDRLIGYGLNGVVIYRNLNPVTNLTTRGAQILASRP